MRTRCLICVTTILLAGTAWAQDQVCNPVCATQPLECCNQPLGGDLLYECAKMPRGCPGAC
jgi:hypothetical protein